MRSALALLADESAFAANDNFVQSVAGAAFTHDLRGNLRNSGARAYCYDLENRLVGVAGAGSVNCATPIMTLS